MNRPAMTLEEFEQMLVKHDHTYEFSDDHRAWTAGYNEAKAIINAFSQLKEQGLESEARAVYKKISSGWNHA